MIHYGVTKTAQLSLARGLAKYVAGSGVTVNSVLPGPTISDGFAEMLKDDVAKTGQSLEELASVCHDPSSELGDPAGGLGGRGRQYGGLRLLAARLSHLRAALRVDGSVVDDIL